MKKYTKDRDFWCENHERVGSIPELWFITAEQLRFSYKILAEHANGSFAEKQPLDETFSSSLMLAGFAIENFLKGLLVKKDPDNIFDKKGMFKYKSHNLLNMAQNIGMSLTKEEEELLEIIMHYVLSAGRYPIPLSPEDSLPREFSNGTVGPITMQSYDNKKKEYKIYNRIDNFFERLRELCQFNLNFE